MGIGSGKNPTIAWYGDTSEVGRQSGTKVAEPAKAGMGMGMGSSVGRGLGAKEKVEGRIKQRRRLTAIDGSYAP